MERGGSARDSLAKNMERICLAGDLPHKNVERRSAGDVLVEYVPNDPSDCPFLLQERVVPIVGRDPYGPSRAG